MTPDPAVTSAAVTSDPGVSRLLRCAFWATVAGVLLSLLLFLRPGPYMVTVFMAVAQPLLVAGFVLFVIEVYRELRHRNVL